MIVHNQVIEQIPAYALDALPPQDMLQVASHLAECADCQREYEAYLKVVAELPFAASQRSPRPKLKDRLMTQVRSQMRWSQAKSQPDSWILHLRTWLMAAAPVWGVVSMALLVLTTIGLAGLWQRLQRLESTSHVQVVALRGTENAPGASGMLLISADGMDVSLIVNDLPSLDSALQYQLWLIRDGVRTSGGVFSTAQDGNGYLNVNPAGSIQMFDSFGITVEPAGGSSGPTGRKVMGGEF